MSLRWYLLRLLRMSPLEVMHRVRDAVVKRLWRRKQVANMRSDPLSVPESVQEFESGLASRESLAIDDHARAELLKAADDLLAGCWNVFGLAVDGIGEQPDWFLDHRNAKHAPQEQYAFDINHRDAERIGVPKHVWELSRHSHVSMLAAGYFVSGEVKYAERARAHLLSWWDQNPFMSGIHWTSGIEIGLRLISWVWTRRLLGGWLEASDLFEGNRSFKQQLHHHQLYLDTFPSHGTSANNHLIAEVAGQFIACCAFPYFAETPRWRDRAAAQLTRALTQQTFPSGLNREQATEYHGFVLELALFAGLEGERVGESLGETFWSTVIRQFDALAAIVDVRIHPPRQGDGDDGCALLVDAPSFDRWGSLLATGAELFGAREWWPRVSTKDVRTSLLASFEQVPSVAIDRPVTRPAFFSDAGLGILRGALDGGQEVWCRCDGGPHGYDTVAGHAHADALSIELRIDGVDIFADPGTYTYHGEAAWRSYFRSTRGHNTLELDGEDQSVPGGEFFWTQHAESEVLESSDDPGALMWRGRHSGYMRLPVPAMHARTVKLDLATGTLSILDEIDSPEAHAGLLAFHLGPEISCELVGTRAELTWINAGQSCSASIELPSQFQWKTVRGQEDPPLGWYSRSFGEKVPSVCLVGTGSVDSTSPLETHCIGLCDNRSQSNEGERVT